MTRDCRAVGWTAGPPGSNRGRGQEPRRTRGQSTPGLVPRGSRLADASHRCPQSPDNIPHRGLEEVSRRRGRTRPATTTEGRGGLPSVPVLPRLFALSLLGQASERLPPDGVAQRSDLIAASRKEVKDLPATPRERQTLCYTASDVQTHLETGIGSQYAFIMLGASSAPRKGIRRRMVPSYHCQDRIPRTNFLLTADT